ncbi:rolling circle replication-associated protein [Paenibacillus ferrarius]|uniref:rolling circle replication-associated protein n=1 Tax=Paenibacillus ferrarius TaxID=1469647 RepID=UPI003D2BAAFF
MKIISYGNYLELILPDRPTLRGENKRCEKRSRNKLKGEQRTDNIWRSKWKFIRTVRGNFKENFTAMVTLSYKREFQTTDIKRVNKDFSNFIGKLRLNKTCKWIRVLEFTNSVPQYLHVHMLINSLIDLNTLENKWTKGKVHVQRICTQRHLENITRYLHKQFDDSRLSGKRKFASSESVEKPIEIVGKSAEYLYQKYCLDSRKPIKNSSYMSKFNGMVKCRSYFIRSSTKNK